MSLPDKYIKDDASSQIPCGLCTPECGDPKSLSASKPETWNLKPETGEALYGRRHPECAEERYRGGVTQEEYIAYASDLAFTMLNSISR